MWLIFEKFIWGNIFDVLSFPFWWYGRGLKEVVQRIMHSISKTNDSLGVSLWISNIFTPMFGQSDWQGRIISFFMRFFQIIFRTLFFVVWVLILFALLVLWITVFPLTVFLIVYSVFYFK